MEGLERLGYLSQRPALVNHAKIWASCGRIASNAMKQAKPLPFHPFSCNGRSVVNVLSTA